METNKDIATLQYITHENERYNHAQLAEQACLGGCKWIQLRLKDLSYNENLSIALATQKICKQYGAKLIINDHVEIAKKIEADGIHLGKNDMLPLDARRIVGDNIIIGGTANIFEDILHLHYQRVDYIGLGPFRYTTTKKNLAPIIGIEGYKRNIRYCNYADIQTPIIAIGGIEAADIPEIMNTGIYGIAVSGAIGNAIDIPTKTKQLIDQIHQTR